ncbi:MAG: mannitol dehydrogenase family protein [Pseudomonadota bacterium]
MSEVFQPEKHDVGIVHFGPGAFHRAHQAVYTEDAMRASGGDWRIEAVSMQSTATADALNAQDGKYTLVTRGETGTSFRQIASIAKVHAASRDVVPIKRALQRPETRIVSMTITEKGYRPNTPLMGLIVEALAHRFENAIAPFSVMSCDNLTENGAVVRNAVLETARALKPDQIDLILEHVAFPSSMVDRITPASTQALIHEVAAETGAKDRVPVETEAFSQWVIEERFSNGRPGWEAAGALLVPEVAPYEKMKLRMLNGAHSMLAYAGYLSGKTFVRDVMADPHLAALVDHHMQAAAQTLDPIPGVDFSDYRNALLARFRNPYLAHETYQIAMDGSQKLPQRIFAPAVDAIVREQDVSAFAFATAAWLQYTHGQREDGSTHDLRDPREAELTALPPAPAERFDAMCRMDGLMPDALSGHARFRSNVIEHLENMSQIGMRETVRKLAFG